MNLEVGRLGFLSGFPHAPCREEKTELSGPSVKFTSAPSINDPGLEKWNAVSPSFSRLIIIEPGMETRSHFYHWKVCICEMESVHRVSTLKDSRRLFSAIQFSGLVKGDFWTMAR